MKTIIRNGITFELREDDCIHITEHDSDGEHVDYFTLYWFKQNIDIFKKSEVIHPFNGKSIDVYPGVIQLLSTHHPELLI
jgi:hypothetical protein